MVPTNVTFIFIILVAGYLFCNLFHRTHWALKRSSGYHTFLLSALAGLLILIAVSLLRLPLIAYGPDFNFVNFLHENGFPSISIASSTHVLLELGTAAVLLAAIAPFLLYAITSRIAGASRQELLEGTFVNFPGNPEFTSLIFSSFDQGLPILFTLSDRKVFIGYPVSVKAEDFNDIRILPAVSGYRAQETLELVLTTNYKKVLEDLMKKQDIDPEAFVTTLPTREIVHAHLFDLTHYERFRPHSGERVTA